MENKNKLLYSVVLELSVTNTATIGASMGHQAHALFLALVRQVNSELATRLHDANADKPFTVSPLRGGRLQGEALSLRAGDACRLRFTLLDGGEIWQCLNQTFLENRVLELRLGAANFAVNRIIITPNSDTTGWAGYTDWPTLVAAKCPPRLRLRFASPTAFHHSGVIVLFPDPLEVWDSLMRVWNKRAPAELEINKEAVRQFIKEKVLISDYELQTTTLRFPSAPQKGFLGYCSYLVKDVTHPLAGQFAGLAEFARYAGLGHKTTQGMGQVRLELP